MRYSTSLSVALFTLVPGLLASPFGDQVGRRLPESSAGNGHHPDPTSGVHAHATQLPASGNPESKCRLFADAWLGQDWIMEETCKDGKTTTVPMWMTEEVVYATAKPSAHGASPSGVHGDNRRRAQEQNHPSSAAGQHHSAVPSAGGAHTSDSAQAQLTTIPVGKPATVVVCQSCPAGPSRSSGPGGPSGASRHSGTQPTGGAHDNKRFAKP